VVKSGGYAVIDKLINDIKGLVKNFRKAYQFLKDVKKIYEDEFKGNDGIVMLPKEGRYLIVGDLHGDFNSLTLILEQVDLKNFIDSGGKVIFLGDYIDRGPMQPHVILTVFMLKTLYPESIITLRGNHEPPKWLMPYPHDFPDVLKMVYGATEGTVLYSSFFEIFQKMPYAALIRENALLVHGGPPTVNIEKSKDLITYINVVKSPYSKKILEEILWNDPIEADVIAYPSPRGAGFLFGRRTTRLALNILKVNMIIRAHEPVDGIRFSHNGRVVTVFSMKGYYFNRYGAYIDLNTGDPLWLSKFESMVHYY